MKPLNSNTSGCTPVSSNCVIWQGPDIECIKLCKGDTVSDIVNKLATELCTIMEYTNVSSYDLTCLNLLGCDPKTFEQLIQLLIDKICEINAAANTRTAGDEPAGCPDCEVNIAPCFYYTNEFGDEVTTMQLKDYAITAGNKICDILTQIDLINATLIDHETRIEALENAPDPTILLPQVTPTCVITPAVPTEMDTVLSALEQQFCQLVTVTGTPNSLYQALLRQCINLNNSPALGPTGGNMSSLPGWVTTVNNLAGTINNMWLTICDLRAAVANIQLNCCPSGCDGIDFTLQAALSGPFLSVYFTGTIPVNFADCNPLGSTFRIQDTTGGTINVNIPVVSYMNAPGGYSIDLSTTPINLASDMDIHSDICVRDVNTGSTCQICVDYTLRNQANCPVLSVSVTSSTEATVTFTPISTPATYTLELWDAALTTVLQTQSVVIATPAFQTFTFAGLSPSFTYNVRLVITSGTQTTDCPYAVFTTLPVVCTPPSGVYGVVSIPVECTTCGTALNFASQAPL